MLARDRLRDESKRLETNAHEFQQQVEQLQAIVKSRQVERQQLQVLLNAARRELDERRASGSDGQSEVVATAESRKSRPN